MNRLLAPVLLLSLACSPPPTAERLEYRPGRAPHDTSPVPVDRFGTDLGVQIRVLHMPFGEAAARLGSLTYTAESMFVFSRGASEFEQRDRASASQDGAGNFAVALHTPRSEVAVSLVDQMLYVSLDKGKTRHKPRRSLDAERWCDLAFAGMHQSLEPFRPRLAFSNPQHDTVNGRAATRFTIGLAATPEVPKQVARPRSALPLAMPARWREQANPLSLEGKLWLDAATGTPLKIDMAGRLEIADRDVRPSQLRLEYRGEISDVGEVAAIGAPTSVAEFRRIPPPTDPLAFFARHLPKPIAAPTPTEQPVEQP